MSTLNLLKFPHKTLLKPCEEVTVFNKGLLKILDDMWDTVKEHKALGLAGNQVDIPLDIIVLNGPKGRVDLINPYISASSLAYANMKEACLSAPGVSLTVPNRSLWVQARYQNKDGDHMAGVFQDIYAVCVQHELEHLDGRAFFENKSIPSAERKKLIKKWGMKK